MSRFLEAVFVFGSALVGFGLSASDGNAWQQMAAQLFHVVVAACSGMVQVTLL